MKFFKTEVSEKKMKIAFSLPESKLEAPNGYIEFFLPTKISAEVLGIKMIGSKRIEEMDQRADYNIIFIAENSKKIRITGNLYNAFAMLNYRQILPYESTKSLKQISGFNEGLDLTKTIIFENIQGIDGSVFSFT